MEILVNRPEPTPTTLTQPFWDGCQEGRLVLQRCIDCRQFRFYPSAGCPHCGSTQCAWEAVSGRGSVYSWIVVNKTHDPYWSRRVPYVCAIVELQEQRALFIPGLLVDVVPTQVRAGMPLEISFERASHGRALPTWTVRAEA